MALRQPIVTILGHVDHGKCIAPDTLIPLTSGEVLSAEKLYEIYSNKGEVIEIDDGLVIKVENGPEVFSFDGRRIVKKKITHLWKRVSPSNLVRVKIASGHDVIVTKEHPFFICRDDFIGWKSVSELDKNDFILVPAYLNAVDDECIISSSGQFLKEINAQYEKSVKFVKISEIETIESKYDFVYDFTVPDTSNFVANRFIVHNTSLLDAIRSTTVAAREAGAITQHIGASEVPLSVIQERCKPLSKFMNINFTIPGLLFIDTPGHAAFTNLRKRGGNIADIAILVVDITQGFQPQTIEALEILKEYRTPFVVAANKIDLITGWKNRSSCFLESAKLQRQEILNDLDAKIYTLVGELSKYGFQADRFDRVTDFTKTVAIIPVSAKTQEGLPELLMMISGLAQKFLESQLKSSEGPGKCNIMEVKFEKGLGVTADVILYDGIIKKGDTIIFATKSGIKTTKVRGLLKPKPLVEMRDIKGAADRFTYVDEVHAASGLKIFAPELEDALPGSSLYVVWNESEMDKIKSELENELKEILIKTENIGIIIKADTLGSLEAIIKLLESEGVKIRKADVGPVSKTDVLEADSIRQQDRYSGLIIAFNVSVDPVLEEEARQKGFPIIKSNIIYSILDQLKEWREQEKIREQQEAMQEYVFPAKIKFLPGYAFRANKPAIFGVEVLIGRIKQGDTLMKEDGTEIGIVKSIQVEKQSRTELKAGEQGAISMDEPTIGRHIFEGEIYLTKVPLKHALTLQNKYKQFLTGQELDLLDQIMRLTRK
jgi:translation initiation factor 5B